MLHLGDIQKISGYTAPIVDCIVAGSPCQDLSVAGKRAGLDGERSGLFMDQVRIVKEMRDRDVRDNGRAGVDVRPRYLVWENVPGAFSSNKGEDFRIVLEEIARVKDKDAVVPRPDKWQTSGCILGDGWSIAWRVLDAQFWGVPQRRRRIALVADFGGHSAPEILFVSEGVSGHPQPSESKRKATARDAERSIGADDCLGADQYLFQPVQPWLIEMTSTKNTISSDGICPTLTARMGTGGNQVNAVLDTSVIALDRAAYNQGQNAQFDFDINDGGIASTIVAKGPSAVCYTVDQGAGKSACSVTEGQAPTLACTHDGAPAVCYDTVGAFYPQMKAESQCFRTDGISNYLVNGTNPGFQNAVTVRDSVRTRYTVRRLTPLECERLQGYPDGWTDIGEYIDSNGRKKQSSDAARYKALGNSIAIPPWKWVMKRLCACYERDATLASLFDGIGGFPYIWEQINGKGSCLWASEIEEFPMAVTKVRIGE